jgi:two-component system response regulator DegU
MNILVVDDSPEMRELIRNCIGDLADDVHECGDGEEVLPAYAKWKPDWVLMDIRLGDLDGLTVTRRVLAAYPAARIAIVTTYEGDEWRQAARRAGACAYVPKSRLLDVRLILSGSSVTGPED